MRENLSDGTLAAGMTRREFIKGLGVASATLALSGCVLPFGGGEDDGDKGTDHIPVMDELLVCKMTPQAIFSLDPVAASSTSATEILAHALSGLARWVEVDGVLTILPDLAKELPEPTANKDGTWTVTYEIDEAAAWSDDRPVLADDFVFAWNRAADVANGCTLRDLFDCVAGFSNEPGGEIAVEATGDRRLTVTLTKLVPYWNELLSLTAFMPLRRDFIAAKGYSWTAEYKVFPYNGPYVIENLARSSLESDTNTVKFRKNKKYLRVGEIGPEVIRFVYGKSEAEQLDLIKGSTGTGMPSATDSDSAKIGGVHILCSASTSLLESTKSMSGVQRRAIPLLGTDWMMWNMNQRLVPESLGLVGDDYERAQAEIRQAFSLMLDRPAITADHFGFKAAASVVPPGMADAGGADFSSNAGSSGHGYYDTSEESFKANREKAIGILRKYYTYDEGTGWFDPNSIPRISYLQSGETLSQAASALLTVCTQIGIHIEPEFCAYESLAEKRQSGDFMLSSGNWYADFTDPIAFLSLWTTNSPLNDCQLGRGQHAEARIYKVDLSGAGQESVIEGARWAESYDRLIAMIGQEGDKQRRSAMLHKAEDILMGTGALMPIWYPANAYVARDSIYGVEAFPFNWMFYGRVYEK